MLAGFVVPSDLDPLEVFRATARPHIMENATAANSTNLFKGLCHYFLRLEAGLNRPLLSISYTVLKAVST